MNHNSMSITQWYWHLHNARIMHNNQVKAKIFAHTEYLVAIIKSGASQKAMNINGCS
jgi:L-asparagine transporter-like permease